MLKQNKDGVNSIILTPELGCVTQEELEKDAITLLGILKKYGYITVIRPEEVPNDWIIEFASFDPDFGGPCPTWTIEE